VKIEDEKKSTSKEELSLSREEGEHDLNMPTKEYQTYFQNSANLSSLNRKKSLGGSTYNKFSAHNNSFINTIKHDTINLRIDCKTREDERIFHNSKFISTKRSSIISKL
jgi:hypothetical protein